MSEMVRIDKSKYDELCHQVRHLGTLAKIVSKIVERINSLEELLGCIDGDVVDCSKCSLKDECDYAYKHCPSIGTDKT